MRIEKIKAEIDRLNRKIVEYQARVKDLERQKTEQENMEILDAVRSIAASPEEIREVLARIRAAKPATPSLTVNRNEEDLNEEEKE